MIQLIITIYAGFTHAFEADHLLAVGNLVTARQKMKQALKDGLYWGLGHTSTILLIGLLMLVFKLSIPRSTFHYLEALVGVMLVCLGGIKVLRYFKTFKSKPEFHVANKHKHHHSLAYGVGLMHGLAGSGALVILVMAEITQPLEGLRFLIVFGMGSILGMLFAAGILSLPLSKQFIRSNKLQSLLSLTSALLCLTYGSKVIYDNLFT